jgi:hypothetical protein
MPQAPDWLRESWGGKQGVGDDKAIEYLESKGYTLTGDHVWNKPNEEHKVTKEENQAILFLMMEWDYGGIEEE